MFTSASHSSITIEGYKGSSWQPTRVKIPQNSRIYPRWLCWSCLATFFTASKMCIIVRFWEYKMKTLTLGRELEKFFICPIIPNYCQDLPLELFMNAVVVFISTWFDDWRCAGIQKCSQIAAHAQQMDLSPTKDGLFSGNGEWMMTWWWWIMIKSQKFVWDQLVCMSKELFRAVQGPCSSLLVKACWP